MKIPKSFPAKGWRRVSIGDNIKKGDVFKDHTRNVEASISVGWRVDGDMNPIYRKIKPKARK